MITRDPAPDLPTAPALVRAAAFGVHLLTALGAALALLALFAAAENRWPLMFLWLGLALIVDTVDGPIARRVRVAELLPRWAGDVLDLVVDFITYVFVPAFAIARGGFLPAHVDVLAGIVIVTTGVLYFADRRMKTADNYFRGFPAVWNAAAFILFLLRPGPWVSGAMIAALAVLTFVPIVFVHPFRVVRLRALNAVLLAVALVLCVVAIARDLAPGPWVTGSLCAVCVYFLGAGLLRRRSDP
ncbi:MAG TPA: phosphatidylcholine synthase [Xanthobacteraceae bacterium]|nr:phosphatidylcholine synthase [Xanthobacteraceae bacterium]